MAIAKERIMKRMYLSKILGDGSFGNPFRHVFQDQTTNIEYKGGEIKGDAQGHPVAKALLIIVGATDHRPFQSITGLVPLPDVTSDTKVSSIHAPTKLACKARIKAQIGHSDAEIEEVWGNADGMRDVTNHYGLQNNDTFDVNNFDLTDL